MTYSLPTLFTAALLGLATLQANAQTISTLDDLTLPGTDTSYSNTIAPGNAYAFTSGLVTFHGNRESWGGYSGFNYSNVTDTVTSGPGNDKAAITGKGYNQSANYGIAYAPSDWPAHPKQSLLLGAKVQNGTTATKATGMYVTNTTYAYRYIKATYHNGDSFRLVVRGYRNAVRTADSASFTLARYATGDTVVHNTWQWMDLSMLGYVDSLSFQVSSTDDYTPFYFAFDNLTIEKECPAVQGLTATTISSTEIKANWSGSIPGMNPDYEIAVDLSPTLAPAASTTTITGNSYNATGLTPWSLYYVHIRSTCGGGISSAWDTVSARTFGVAGIFNTQANDLQLSISPNPARDIVELHCDNAVNASVYSIEGKIVLSATRARRINVSSLPAGIYLLKVTDAAGSGKQATLRFTKQN